MNSSSTIKSFLIANKTVEQNSLTGKVQRIITVMTGNPCEALLYYIPVLRNIYRICFPELKIPIWYFRLTRKKLFRISVNGGHPGCCFYPVEINLICNQTV